MKKNIYLNETKRRHKCEKTMHSPRRTKLRKLTRVTDMLKKPQKLKKKHCRKGNQESFSAVLLKTVKN